MNINSGFSSSSSNIPSSWKSKQQAQKNPSKLPMYLSLALILVLLAAGATVWAVMRNKDDNKNDNQNSSSSSSSSESSTSSSSSSTSTKITTTSSSSSSEDSSTTSSAATDVELDETVVVYEGDIAANNSVGFKKCQNSTCTHYLLPNSKKNIFPLLDPGSMYMISAETLIEEDSAAGNQYYTMDGDIKIYIQAVYKETLTGIGDSAADQSKSFLVFDSVLSSDIEEGSHSYTEHLMLNEELVSSIFPFLNNINPGQKVKIYVSSLKNLGNAAGNHYNELGGAIEIGLM